MLIDLQPEPRSTRSRAIVLMLEIAVCAILCGCASEIVRTPTHFTSAGTQHRAEIVLTESLIVVPVSGYTRTLKAGSRWQHVGDIPEGAVFKVENDVFMVEGKNRHEAYCVLNHDFGLVGFYLPVENSFISITPTAPLPITNKRN